jgi:hypothetical protein
VLVAGGYSAILLGVLYQIIDVWDRARWSAVFVWIGTNATALSMLANVMNCEEMAATRFDCRGLFRQHVTAGTGHLLSAVSALAPAICAANYLLPLSQQDISTRLTSVSCGLTVAGAGYRLTA